MNFLRRSTIWSFPLILLASCGDHPLPDPPAKTAPSQQDLIAFHRERARQLDSLISATTSDWPGVQSTGTGIRFAVIDRTAGRDAVASLPQGSILQLHHRISLLDGKTITEWQTDGPIAFRLGATDLPEGFHEIIGSALLGDSLHALIPPARAWGMSGLPPDIPQEAVIAVEVRIEQYQRPT